MRAKLAVRRAVVLVAAAITCCVTPIVSGQTTEQAIHPRLKSREVVLRSFAVVPPAVKVPPTELKPEFGGTRGAVVMDILAGATWSSTLASVITEELKKSGWEVKALPAEDTLVIDLKNRYVELDKQINNMPDDVGKGLFTLGAEAQKVGSLAPVDALVLVQAVVRITSVKGTPDLFGGATFGDFKYAVSGRYTIVDAENGDVLYSFPIQVEGSEKKAGGRLKKTVKTAISKLPR